MNGILLHIVSAIFVAYLSFSVVQKPAWNALFWVILLFTSVSAIAKSFIQESHGRLLYFYQIASPEAVILSKILYNTLLLFFLSLLCFVVYSILIGNLAENTFQFLMAVFLTGIGFASIFTMISAIASKAGNSNLLMPVLSFPVILPLLLVGIKASKLAADGIETNTIYTDFGVLMLINLLVIILAYVLFPYLWRE